MPRLTFGALDELLRELVRTELAAARIASFEWVPWEAWAKTPRQARRLAAAEGIRMTKLGRCLFGHRDDLTALAVRNEIKPATDVDTPDEGATAISARVAAAFGRKP